MPEVIELRLHEEIDRVSKQLKNPAFGAYINLEGVFHGVERIIGESVPKVFKIITEKSRGKCYYIRASFRRSPNNWDELEIIICGNQVVAANGVIDGKEMSGSDVMAAITDNVNNKAYNSAILELIELPVNFAVKRFGISIELEEAHPPEEEVKAKEIGVVEAQAPENIQESTISIETSIEKTHVLPREVMKKFYQKMFTRIPPPVIERHPPRPEEKLKPIRENIDEILGYEKEFLKIMEEIVNTNEPRRYMNISTLRIKRHGDKLLVEVHVTKLGMIMKKEKMTKIAMEVAELIKKTINTDYLRRKFNEITVVAKHGWDLVKINTKI